jgi:hypothetical protein
VSLAREARADRWIVRELGREHLDGHAPVETEVARAVHHCHPAAADLALELVLVTDGGEDALV